MICDIVEIGGHYAPAIGGAVRLRRWLSPVGELVLGEYGGRICLCDWALDERRKRIDGRIGRLLRARFVFEDCGLTDRLITELEEYFAGDRREFGLPLLLVGTDFQMLVWQALMGVNYGETVSYTELARLVGRPEAVRAVARAVGDNPLSILLPCHRVVGSDGSLTGYAGGLAAKQSLLALEGA